MYKINGLLYVPILHTPREVAAMAAATDPVDGALSA